MTATLNVEKVVLNESEAFDFQNCVWAVLAVSGLTYGWMTSVVPVGHKIVKHNVHARIEQFQDLSAQLCRDTERRDTTPVSMIVVDDQFVGTMPTVSQEEGCVVTTQIKAQFKLVEDLTIAAIDHSRRISPDVLLVTRMGSSVKADNIGTTALGSWLERTSAHMKRFFHSRICDLSIRHQSQIPSLGGGEFHQKPMLVVKL